MALTPSGFTAACTSSLPTYTPACCRALGALKRTVRSSRARSTAKSPRPENSTGSFLRSSSAHSTAERAWAITVAQAAPATPQPSRATNSRSSPTFASDPATRQISGVTVSPMDREAAASMLYSAVTTMPAATTRR